MAGGPIDDPGDEGDEGAAFQEDESGVDVGGDADAEDEQERGGADHAGGVVRIAGPEYGDGGRTETVFEEEGAADEPRREVAERGAGILVRRAGAGFEGGEFGVAERGERAPEGGDQVARQKRRRAVLARQRGGSEEDAPAHHTADTGGDEVAWTQGAGEQLRA